MWVPVRIEGDPANWYVMHERSHLVCGPAGTEQQARDWCSRKNAGEPVTVMRGHLGAVAESVADTPHVVGASR